MLDTTHRTPAPPQISSDRSFGFVFATVFLLVGLQPLLHAGPLRLWAMALAGAFLVVAALAPGMLGPANRLWSRFGLLLHRLTSPIALGILFFLVVLPTGLVMRLFGKDPLRRRFEPALDSYWIRRPPRDAATESLRNPF